MLARPSNDFVRTEVSFSEFAGWTCDIEDLRGDEDVLSDVDFRRRGAILVRGNRVGFLREFDLILEEDVEFVEIDCEITSAERSDFSIRMDGNARIVAFVRVEGRDACGVVGVVVGGKLCEREESGPIVLLIAAVETKVLFQGLVGTFGLSVGFRMMSDGVVEFDVQNFPEGSEKVGNEFRASIRSDVRGNTVLGKDMNQEELSEFSRINGVVAWNEDALTGESINDDENIRVSVRVG